MPRLKKLVSGACGSVVALGAVVATAAPAQAIGTVCNANTAWYTITSQTTYDQIDSGDYSVFRAPSNTSLRVTTDLTRTAGTAATTTTSVGASMSVSAGVSVFNAQMGLSASSSNEMQTTHTYTKTVTQDVTIPAGHSMAEYVGHAVTRANMERRLCNSSGTAYSAIWRGSVTGPRYAVYGWEDCLYTSLC